MTTFNISLTDEQAKLVDELTIRHGFASRSEFFRAMLRRVSVQPKVALEAAIWPFTQPEAKSKNIVLKEFKKSGVYSDKFLADLADGLKNSTFFDK
jgi:Arc/MetJ-type ribon-helix-helix transcriptional regulator